MPDSDVDSSQPPEPFPRSFILYTLSLSADAVMATSASN
jgi:hypothetical protein